MKVVTKDARNFVEGIVGYLREGGKTPSTLPKVSVLLRRAVNQAQKDRQVKVESAVSLTTDERQHLARVLAELLGKSPALEFEVNKNLVGGLKIQAKDWIIDTSLAKQLETML